MPIDEKLKILTQSKGQMTSEFDEGAIKRYCYSKMCNVLFALALHRREHDSHGINVYVLHPGVIATGFAAAKIAFITTFSFLGLATNYKLFKHFSGMITFFGKTAEQGAATTVYCATNPTLNDVSGRYYVDCSAGNDETKHLEHKMARDEALQDALWNYSQKLIEMQNIDDSHKTNETNETMHF